MDAVSLLKQDHAQVAALFEQFEAAGDEDKTSLAARICQLLTVHAQIEEELLYPAARTVLAPDDEDLVDEATVEHASVKDLVGQIETAGAGDDLFEAKVTVLGEYVTHHVKEEEGELFPKLKKTDLDLSALGKALDTRKSELMTELGISADDPDESDAEDDEAGEASPAAEKSKTLKRSGNRPTAR
jgi:hemerythrin superfamily protein